MENVDMEEELNQQLSTLRDVHWPLAPGWLPEAPGFWVLLGVLLYLLLVVLWRLWRRHLAPYLEALRILDELDAELTPESDEAELLRFAEECKILIKRYARTIYPDEKPDTLIDHQWQAFLQLHSNLGPPPPALTDALYQLEPDIQPDNLKLWARGWIQNQRFRWR